MARMYKSRSKAERAAKSKNARSRKAKYDVEARYVVVKRKSLLKRLLSA